MNQPQEDPQPARADKPAFLTDTRFDSFDIPEVLKKGLADAGFDHCTPIQTEAIPIALTGKDVAGQAQTGTGKTAAYLVPIMKKLLEGPASPDGHPRALVVAPTRELALQIVEDARLIGAHTDLTVAKAVGGMEYQKQADTLRGESDILVGTPGRIIDYMKQGVFVPRDIQAVVIDEADRLLDMGFAQDMRYILRKLPHFTKRQGMLFSATLSYRVMELTYEYMNLPEVVTITPKELAVEGIEQSLFHVGMDEKLPLLLGLLEREDWTRVLIFTNTKSNVEWLATKLSRNGYPAKGISGDLPQNKRLTLVRDFKEGKVKILVATDVASRGIHVDDITHVFNYDLPQDVENYVHRIGRTARAGKTGRALSLACENYVFHLEPLEEFLGYKIPVVWPEPDWLIKDEAGHVARRRSPAGPKKGGRPGGKPGGKPRGRSGPRPPAKRAAKSTDAKTDQPPKKRRRSGASRRRKKKPAGEATGGEG